MVHDVHIVSISCTSAIVGASCTREIPGFPAVFGIHHGATCVILYESIYMHIQYQVRHQTVKKRKGFWIPENVLPRVVPKFKIHKINMPKSIVSGLLRWIILCEMFTATCLTCLIMYSLLIEFITASCVVTDHSFFEWYYCNGVFSWNCRST